jgi:hypothetical protein
MPSMSNKHPLISYVDIVYGIKGLSDENNDFSLSRLHVAWPGPCASDCTGFNIEGHVIT